MNLKTIQFPVYPITKPITILGTATVFIDKEEEYEYLDDKSILLPTLGQRRLNLKEQGKKLITLGIAIYFIKDLLKLKYTKYIDTFGKVFEYRRSKMVDLIFRKITKIIPISTGGVLVEVDEESPRYKLMYAPNPLEKYVGMLRITTKTYVIYGLFTEKHKDTRRKI